MHKYFHLAAEALHNSHTAVHSRRTGCLPGKIARGADTTCSDRLAVDRSAAADAVVAGSSCDIAAADIRNSLVTVGVMDCAEANRTFDWIPVPSSIAVVAAQSSAFSTHLAP